MSSSPWAAVCFLPSSMCWTARRIKLCGPHGMSIAMLVRCASLCCRRAMTCNGKLRRQLPSRANPRRLVDAKTGVVKSMRARTAATTAVSAAPSARRPRRTLGRLAAIRGVRKNMATARTHVARAARCVAASNSAMRLMSEISRWSHVRTGAAMHTRPTTATSVLARLAPSAAAPWPRRPAAPRLGCKRR